MEAQAHIIRNRYVLEAALGKGGMGVVYRAFDRLTGQTVALKRISQVPAQNAPDTEDDTLSDQVALAQEFQVLASLYHPYIIRVQDYGFDEQGRPFFTMELVENAENFLKATLNIDIRGKIELLIQILQALAYLHRHRIVHRDLKPSNILVTRDNIVHLLDFGLATPTTRHPELVGTMRYIAPEVLLSQKLSPSTDLFTFGIIAYEVFTGQHPFVENEASYREMINKVLMGQPHLDALPEGLPISNSKGSLRAVIGRLLARKPQDRYATAEDVIADFSALIGQPSPTETEDMREGFLRASAFVGRVQELNRLKEAFAAAQNGQGKAILIGGESGIGKSRLVEELRIHTLVNGALVLRGQAVDGGGLFYQLWRAPLRRLALHIPLTDEEAGVLYELIPDIESLLQRNIPPVTKLSGSDDQQRLINTIVTVFKKIQQPTVLILEDLQWTHESLEALKAILPLVHNLPLLIIGTYRNDETPNLPQKLPDMELITLERLSKSHITALSAAMLGEAGSQPQVVDLLYRETEGNVFFIVEVVRALAESAGSLSHIGLATLPAHITAGGVKEIVESRLNRVPEQLALFLKLAAIAGRQIDPDIMRALIAQNEAARQAAATALLHDASAPPQAILDYMLMVCSNAAVLSARENTWSFAHDKLREAVLERIPAEEKSRLYRQVTETIEQVHGDNLEPWAFMLAQYWAEAGDRQKEAYYTFIAAEQVARSGVLSLARQLFQRLLQIRAYEFHENPMLHRGIIMHRLGSIFRRMGNFELAIKHEQEAITLFEQLQEQQWLCSAYGEMGDIYLRYEQVEPAKAYFDKSLKLARAIGDPKTLGFAVMNLGNLAQVIGDGEGSLPYRIESYNLLKEAGTPVEFSKAINNLAITYDMLGDYQRAIALHEEGLAIRRKYNDRQGLVYTLNNLGMIYLDMQDYEKARGYLQESLSIAQELNAYMAQAYCLGSMCDIELHTQHYAACRHYAEQLLALATRHDIPYSTLKAHLILGDLALQERDYIAAQGHYAQGLGIAEDTQNLPNIQLCLYKLAIVRLNLNETVTALTILAKLEGVFNEQSRPRGWDMYWELAHKQADAGAEAAVQKGKALSLADAVSMIKGIIEHT